MDGSHLAGLPAGGWCAPAGEGGATRGRGGGRAPARQRGAHRLLVLAVDERVAVLVDAKVRQVHVAIGQRRRLLRVRRGGEPREALPVNINAQRAEGGGGHVDAQIELEASQQQRAPNVLRHH